MKPQVTYQKIMAREFLILLAIATVSFLIYFSSLLINKSFTVTIQNLGNEQNVLSSYLTKYQESKSFADSSLAKEEEPAPVETINKDKFVAPSDLIEDEGKNESDSDDLMKLIDTRKVIVINYDSLKLLTKEDSLAFETHLKFQNNRNEIYSKNEWNKKLKDLWIYVLVALIIIAYPARLLLLITIWSIKTLKA